MAIVDPMRFKESSGISILIYGSEKIGKTTSILMTCPKPCVYVWAEKRSILPNLKIAGLVNPDDSIKSDLITIYEFDGIQATDRFVQEVKKAGKYKCIIADSLTDIMRLELNKEIIDENNRARGDKKLDKLLMTEYKQTQEGYGIANNAMANSTTILRSCATEANMVFIAIARVDEKEKKVNGSFREVPLLMGNDYLRNIGGMFDMIGIVKPLYKDSDGKFYPDNQPGREISYPPMVNFETSDRHMFGWTGPGTKRKFRLDIQEILDSNK